MRCEVVAAGLREIVAPGDEDTDSRRLRAAMAQQRVARSARRDSVLDDVDQERHVGGHAVRHLPRHDVVMAHEEDIGDDALQHDHRRHDDDEASGRTGRAAESA